MSDFIGLDQELAILTRLRSELRKDVLEAAAPRDFDANHLPTGGGYGLDFTGLDAYLPTTWTAGTHEQLCPVLEDGRWVDFETGASIDDATAILPFTDDQVRDGVDEGGGVLTRGAGFMVLSANDLPGPAVVISGQGRRGQLSVNSPVGIQISVPSKRGKGQLNLYTGILAAVLTDATIKANDFATLRFLDPPLQLLPIQEVAGGWLTATWEANAVRYYRPASSRGTP